MANMQLQRTKAITRTAIEQKQSLEVVQTIVHGGLSSLSYLREFFPEKAYEERVYGEGDDIPSYEDYAAARLPRRKSLTSTATKMKILRRGKSRRVDMLLDWLEDGAFPAIAAGTLRALQVFVHIDPDDRSKVLESYTFTIKYVKDASDKQVPAGIELDSSSSQPISVGATSRALQELMFQIMTLCERLPLLPATRYVSMGLVYNTDIDIPEGWVVGTFDKLLLGEAEGWERIDETIDDVFSRFHETSFGISSLRPTQTLPSEEPAIPEDLTYIQERPIWEETRADGNTDAAAHQVPTAAEENVFDVVAASQFSEAPVDGSNGAAVASVPTQIVSTVSKSTNRIEQDTWNARMPSRRASGLDTQSDVGNTQSSNVAEMKGAFCAMMQPENMTQGDTQTQFPYTVPDFRSETTASPQTAGPLHGLPTTGDLRRSEQFTLAEIDAAVKGDQRLALSQTAAAKLERNKAKLKKSARARTKSKGSKGRNSHIVACQCGYPEEEGDMVVCDYCGTWQHLHCHGYTEADDPRIPKDHVCYRCLLQDDEPGTLASIVEVVQKRRVMHHALQGGLKKPSEVAVSLQMSVSDVETVIEHLRGEGYLVSASGTRKKVTWTAVKEGAKYREMMRNLFDPLLHISHHYEIPEAATNQTMPKTLADLQSIQMPPPTTPASRLLHLAQTPGSTLDLRGSMTPFETPSRPRSRPTSGVKRILEDRQADELNNARVKRVQTQYILDARGLSSSPAGSASGLN